MALDDLLTGLSPEWLDFEQKIGTRPCLSGDAYAMREQLQGLGALIATLNPTVYDDLTIENKQTDSGIPIRIYTPKGNEKFPLCIFFHGGGYTTGNLDSEDLVARFVAQKSRSVVVSVDYRLAPEFPFPAGIDDCFDATVWAIDHASPLNADPSRVFTYGGSAGGQLAIGVVLKLIDIGRKDAIKGICAIMPTLIHPEDAPKRYPGVHTSNKEGLPIIDSNSMFSFFSAYQAPASDKIQFPLGQADLTNLPPIYLCAAEFDPLRDDSVLFDRELTKAGVKHKFDYYKGLPHVFFLIPLKESSALFERNTLAGIDFILS